MGSYGVSKAAGNYYFANLGRELESEGINVSLYSPYVIPPLAPAFRRSDADMLARPSLALSAPRSSTLQRFGRHGDGQRCRNSGLQEALGRRGRRPLVRPRPRFGSLPVCAPRLTLPRYRRLRRYNEHFVDETRPTASFFDETGRALPW